MFIGKCTECGEIQEIYRKWYQENDFCGSCRSVDSFIELTDEELEKEIENY